MGIGSILGLGKAKPQNIKPPTNYLEKGHLFADTKGYPQPKKLYSEMDILRACYEDREPMLKFHGTRPNGQEWILDIGNRANRKSLCYMVITQLRDETTWFKREVEERYGFQAKLEIEKIDFERTMDKGYTAQDLHDYKDLYAKESTVVVEALEQVLALIYYNPILREMLRAANQGSQITTSQIDDFMRLIEADLPIVIENHYNGFRGNAKNNGSLFVNQSGRIELRLDLSGRWNIHELIHEYAAFLIVRAANQGSPYFKDKKTWFKGTIDGDELLEEAKERDLKYALLIIDAFGFG